jgi:uncharacterized protein YndB with AHSA1/START domain
MKKLEFKIDINANAKRVWDTMLNLETYKQWVSVSWPGSIYQGQWKKGENLKFISPDQGGTMATIVDLRPYEYILAKHIAVINPDGTEDKNSDIAKGWIGTTEAYIFTEQNGKTEVKVEINTYPDWEKMFSDGWPNALKKLKEITERSRVEATAR